MFDPYQTMLYIINVVYGLLQTTIVIGPFQLTFYSIIVTFGLCSVGGWFIKKFTE